MNCEGLFAGFARAALVSWLAALPSFVSVLNAAEFEVVDKLTANGYTLFRSSVEVRGVVGVSTGTPQAALDIVSTGTTHAEMSQLWRAGDGVIKGSMSATGYLQAVKFIGDGSGLTGIAAGDNLGNHIATTTLNMAAFDITGVSTISASGIYISSYGVMQTTGIGLGSVVGNVRGKGAVDLQPRRIAAAQVASGQYSLIGGGQENTAAGTSAVVGGGKNNTTSDDYAVVSGGRNNTASVGDATVGGGADNLASGYGSVIAGGWDNISAGDASAISGGWNNSAPGYYSSVPGGRGNIASGFYSWAGGYNSVSSADGAFTWSDSAGYDTQNTVVDRTIFKNRGGFLVTGSTNPAMTGTLDRGVLMAGNGLVGISTGAPYAALDVVSSGTASNIYAQIWRNGSGVEVASMTSEGTLYVTAMGKGDNLGNHIATQNLDLAQFPVINVSSLAMVGDGIRIATSVYAGASGVFISTSGQMMTLGLGNGTALPNARGLGAMDFQTYRYASTNVASARYSGIFSGTGNTASGSWAVVLGGDSNVASGYEDVVVGGSWNTASGGDSVVSGGYNNSATSENAVISGGNDNTASGNSSVIAGGSNNTAAGTWASIGGGGYNDANASNSTVSGGYDNHALGDYSSIPGGRGNSLTNSFSFAAGYYAQSTSSGTFTWADSQGTVVLNNFIDRTVFKNRGGFKITAQTGAISANLAMLEVVSTGTASNIYAQIWRNGGGVVVASMTSEGKLFADGSGLTGVSGGSSGPSIEVSTINATATTPYGGVNITTNTFVNGSLLVQSYSSGDYSLRVSTSSTAGQYSIAVSSLGITNINSLVIENRTSDPVAPVTGQIWLRVD